MPLELTPTASATDATIYRKMFGSGTTTFITSNEEKNDVRKIVKSLIESGLLMKGVSQTTKNEAKEQKRGFLGMLLDTLGARILGNLLTGKSTIAASQGRKANMSAWITTSVCEGKIRAGEEKIRAGQDF